MWIYKKKQTLVDILNILHSIKFYCSTSGIYYIWGLESCIIKTYYFVFLVTKDSET